MTFCVARLPYPFFRQNGLIGTDGKTTCGGAGNLRRHLERRGADGLRLADAVAEEGCLPCGGRGFLDICEAIRMFDFFAKLFI